MKFGRLTVIDFGGYDIRNNGEKCSMWICKCDCGTERFRVEAHSLMTGNTRSCGCLHKELAKHHGTGTRLYQTYRNMINRCYREDAINYRLYGAVGIEVCDEWRGDNGFDAFREWAYTNGYNNELTIDRIDNSKGYCPGNCRWATPKEQANNTSHNAYIEYDGRIQTLAQWSEEIGIRAGTLKARIDAWGDVEKAMTTPIRKITYGRNKNI